MKIVVLNQKGGVGKSTITVNLGYGLAKAGKKTLILDLDPQGHSSVIYVPEVPKEETVSELFRNKNFDVTRVIRPAVVMQDDTENDQTSEVENLFIIPSNIHLAASSESIISRTHREKILHNHLKKIENKFDYILVDCPPTLGVLTVNAIYTADLILIPTSYSKYSLDGISDLFNSIAEVKESENYNYRILRSIKDSRSTRTNAVIEEALEDFQDHLLKTVIRRNEAINQAQMVDQPVFLFDPNSSGVQDFTSLTEEIINE
jgi:chromosome partitioning protein